MLKVAAPMMVIAAATLLPVLAWASYDVTGSSPPSPFRTGVGAPAECSGMTFDRVIRGTDQADVITASGSTRDLIFGIGGNDTIDGGNGPDCIAGGEGDDELKGGNADDVIVGGPGNDEIEGGNGDDHLYGGDGDDEIEGEKGNDTIAGGPGNDECEGGQGSNTVTSCEEASSSSRLDQAAATVGPAETVRAFYSLLNERRFADAYDLLTPALQSSGEFTPFGRWVQGYANTNLINAGTGVIQEQQGEQAVVSVHLDSIDRVPPKGFVRQTFSGTWRLRWSGVRWLLDEPRMTLVGSAAE